LNDFNLSKNDSAIVEEKDENNIVGDVYGYSEYVAFEPEQIHMLGSEKDIQNFKDYAKNNPVKEIQVTAPNGKPSKLFNDLTKFLGDEELALKAWARTYTKEFKEWFKDSKVVDENGEPKFVFLDKTNADSNVLAFTDKQSTDPFFLSIKKPQEQDVKTDTISSNRDGIITEDGNYTISNPEQSQSLYGEQDENIEFDDNLLFDPPQVDTLDFKTVGTKFKQYLEFKKDQLIELKDRLRKIKKVKEDLRLKGLHIENNKKQFKEYSKLEEEVQNRINSLDEELRVLKNNSTLFSIQDIANTDFIRLDYLLNKNVLNPSEIKETIELLEFYENMKVDSSKNHPLFLKEQLFHPNGEENYNALPMEVFEYMADLYKEASKRRNKFEEKKKIIVTRIVNNNSKVKNLKHEYTYEEIISAENGLSDLGWIDKNLMDMTMGIFTDNGIVPQVAFAYLQESQDKKLQEASAMGKELDSLQTGVEKELKKLGQGIKIPGVPGISYDMFKQIDELGFETGKIISKFTIEFAEEENSMKNTFRAKLHEAKNTDDFANQESLIKGAYDYKRDWERLNTIQFKLGSIPEIVNNQDFAEFIDYFDESQSDEHSDNLKNILSTKEYRKKIDEQKKLLYRYMAEREAQREMKNTEDFLNWEKVNNPFVSNQYYYNNDDSNFDANLVPNSTYNVSIPRKNEVKITIDPVSQDVKFKDLAAEKNYYDKRFEEIENNEKLYEYHQTLVKILEKIKSNFPLEMQDKIDFNSIIALEKSMTEILLESGSYFDKFSKIAAKFWQKMKNALSVSPQNTVSNLKRNPITGELSHKINAEFINNNASKINLITTVNEKELSQAFGIDKITDFTQIKNHTPAIQKSIDHLNNLKNIEKTKYQNSSSAAAKRKIAQKIKSLDKQLNKIITFDTLETNSKAVEALASYLGTDRTAKAIKERLKGKDTNLKSLIKKAAVDKTAQDHSFDLPKVMKMYLDLSAKYQARERAKPVIELLKSAYDNIKTPVTQNTGENIKHGRGKDKGKVILKGIREEAIAQWDDWFSRVVLQDQGIKHYGLFDVFKVSEENKIRQYFENLSITPTWIKNKFDGKKYKGKNLTKQEKEIFDKIESIIKNEKNPAEKRKLIEQRDKLGKYYSLTGMLNGVLNFARLKGLGWNPLSAITNKMEGEISNLTVMSLGLIDEKSYWEANAIVRTTFAKNLSTENFQNRPRLKAVYSDAKKLRLLNDKFQIIQDSANELQKSSAKSSYSKWGTRLNPYELNKRTEYMIQSKIIVSKLKMQKIKDASGNESSVWDALNEDGTLKPQFKTGSQGLKNIKNWELMTGQQYLDWASNTEAIVNLAHGNYSELRGMMVKSNIFGKAALMFKTWAPMALASRIAVPQTNILLGMKTFKGRWRSFTGVGATMAGGALGFSIGMPFLPFGFTASMLTSVAAGSVAGNVLFRKLLKNDTKTEMSKIQELVFANKMLAMKFAGMPINRLFGKQVGWVKKHTGDYSDYITESFTEIDARNMNANMTNMALMIQRLMLMWGVKALAYGFDDEEEERPEYNLIMNKLQQVNDNVQSFIPGPSSKKLITEWPLFKTLDNILKETTAIIDYLAGDDLETAGPNIRESKLWNQTKKTFVPGISWETSMEKQFSEDPFEKLFISEWKLDRDNIIKQKQQFIANLIKGGMPPGEAKKLANEQFEHLKYFQNPNKELRKLQDMYIPVN